MNVEATLASPALGKSCLNLTPFGNPGPPMMQGTYKVWVTVSSTTAEDHTSKRVKEGILNRTNQYGKRCEHLQGYMCGR